jgi:hypothetical protein
VLCAIDPTMKINHSFIVSVRRRRRQRLAMNNAAAAAAVALVLLVVPCLVSLGFVGGGGGVIFVGSFQLSAPLALYRRSSYLISSSSSSSSLSSSSSSSSAASRWMENEKRLEQGMENNNSEPTIITTKSTASTATADFADNDDNIYKNNSNNNTPLGGRWEELHGNYILRPQYQYLSPATTSLNGSNSQQQQQPRALIHFLGGALLGAAPQLTYRYLLERLSSRGYLIVATPYQLSFDHLATCDEIIERFELVAPDLARREYIYCTHDDVCISYCTCQGWNNLSCAVSELVDILGSGGNNMCGMVDGGFVNHVCQIHHIINCVLFLWFLSPPIHSLTNIIRLLTKNDALFHHHIIHYSHTTHIHTTSFRIWSRTSRGPRTFLRFAPAYAHYLPIPRHTPCGQCLH